ncbi:MAG: rod shape-determining protein [Armatimonadetes bacterium CG_4_10_14_3_um_filter_59_10]|nr:MAG: rod shape-determining protein [Armatimonadetes bacterium CG_4_10_14_3_um_filter_59_10]PJB63870.1 MAG: rod shape-determining protein [Armatimonadetes bacterium CG_4_9_14_3_um_filter_58_7]
MLRLARDIGIDLGTANVLVYARKRGIVLREPSVVAISRTNNKLIAVGEEARQMIGRTPGNIVAIQPMREGVIADYTVTEKMLEHFIHKICGNRRFFKPQVVVCVPSGVTSVERRAVLDAARAAGAKDAYPIEEPMAAAIGAGLPITGPEGNMVIDMGGGTTDIAVISLGGIVVSDSLRIGGNKLDETIARHIKREYSLMIGDRTSEEIKIKVGSAHKLETEMVIEVKGRDMIAGLPKTVVVSSEEVREAMAEPIAQILERVKHVLENTPPELAADIVGRGLWLTGGGALLREFDTLLSLETGIPVQIADDPLSCVAIGAGKALDQLDVLADHFNEVTRTY